MCQCITRTSSLALDGCFDFPQTRFITANLSGSHWPLRWTLGPQTCSAWVSRDCIPVSEDTAPACLDATLHCQLPSCCGAALSAPWQCPPRSVLDLLFSSSPGCSSVVFLERRESSQFLFFFTGFYNLKFSLYLSFPIYKLGIKSLLSSVKSFMI